MTRHVDQLSEENQRQLFDAAQAKYLALLDIDAPALDLICNGKINPPPILAVVLQDLANMYLYASRAIEIRSFLARQEALSSYRETVSEHQDADEAAEQTTCSSD